MNYVYPKRNKSFTIILQTFKDGIRFDSSFVPQIERVFDSSMSLLSGYPIDMVKIDDGLYEYELTFDAGIYLVDVLYNDPNDELDKKELYEVIVGSSIGLSGNNSASI